VVVIHHMPGFDEWIKEVTRKFAAHGDLSICSNLYSREAPGASPDDAAAAVRAKGGVPVAQICHAPLALAAAGVLRGRRSAAFPALAADVRAAGLGGRQ
jgi:carboxymethylenebutenolidase